jgi:hypothetical protein
MKVLQIALSVCCLAVTDTARAGPPFVTDDPEPPPVRGWEINIPFVLERTRDKLDMDAPLLDLNYGLPNIQLKLEIPVKIVHVEGDATDAGPGDMLLGVKWRFIDDEQTQVQLGIYPQLLLPTGDSGRGLGDGRPAWVLPLVAQKSWGRWTLYGDAGYWWQTATDKRDYWYSGAVLEREINERLTLGVELFGNTPKERGDNFNVSFNLGGTWTLREHVNLLFSAGRRIVGDTDVMAYVGLQYLTK